MPPKPKTMKKTDTTRIKNKTPSRTRTTKKSTGSETVLTPSVNQKAVRDVLAEQRKQAAATAEKLRESAIDPRTIEIIRRKYESGNKTNRLELLDMRKDQMISDEQRRIYTNGVLQNMISQRLTVLISDMRVVNSILLEVIGTMDTLRKMEFIRFLTYATTVGIVDSVETNNKSTATLQAMINVMKTTNIPPQVAPYVQGEIERRVSRVAYPTKSIPTRPNVLVVQDTAKVNFGGILGNFRVSPDVSADDIHPNHEFIMTEDPLMLTRAYSKGMADARSPAFVELDNHINGILNPVPDVDFDEMERIRQELIAKLKKKKKKGTDDEDEGEELGDEDSDDEDEGEELGDEDSDDEENDDGAMFAPGDEDDGDGAMFARCAACQKPLGSDQRKSIVKSGKNKFEVVKFCENEECLGTSEIFNK